MEVETTTFPRITKVWAKNFRSIENLELELAPLTVLVGPNASGKSNIVDVLRFVSDALRNGLEAALTSRRGDHAARRTSPRRRFTDITIGLNVNNHGASGEYEFVVRLFRDGRHKVMYEMASAKHFNDQKSGDWRIGIKEGRLVYPRLGRLKEQPEDQYTRMNIEAAVESMTSAGTDLGFPFRSFPHLTSLISPKMTIASFFGLERTLSQIEKFLADMRFYHVFPDALREPQLMASKYPLEERGQNLASVLGDMRQKKNSYFPELVATLSQVVPGFKTFL
jgi:predicted ATPase